MTRAAQQVAAGAGVGTVLDHPLLTLEVAGQPVYLEPDLIAFQSHGQFHIVEIKSFAVIDGQADAGKVAAAAIQSAVYVLALRDHPGTGGIDPHLVSHEAVLVCPEDFSNRPVATLIDVRRQLTVLRRQLARMAQIDTLLAPLPPDLTFDPRLDESGTPTRAPAELISALEAVPARYAPECLSACELAASAAARSHGCTASLGRTVREHLGGIDQVATVLDLATGALPPTADQAEAAALLRAAARLRAEALAVPGERPADSAASGSRPAALTSAGLPR